MKIFNYALIGLGLFLVGCDTTSTNETTDVQNELSALLDNDELIAFVGFEDDGTPDLDYTTGIEGGDYGRIMADTLWPNNDDYWIRLGRTRDSLSREVQWDIDEDNGIAFAHITRTVFGKLRIIAIDSNHAVVDSFVKPFESLFNQSVRFIQNDDENGRPWIVDAFTIGNGKMGDKVSIQQFAVYQPDSSNPLYSFNTNDLGNVYISRDSIPSFAFRTLVRFEVSVSNAGPEFPFRSGEAVLLKYGRGRHEGGRSKFSDSGTGFDAIANDNIFTNVWRIHGPGQGHQRRVFMAWFEVIDFGTLYAEDEVVHSEMWRIPYRSVRP